MVIAKKLMLTKTIITLLANLLFFGLGSIFILYQRADQSQNLREEAEPCKVFQEHVLALEHEVLHDLKHSHVTILIVLRIQDHRQDFRQRCGKGGVWRLWTRHLHQQLRGDVVQHFLDKGKTCLPVNHQ